MFQHLSTLFAPEFELINSSKYYAYFWGDFKYFHYSEHFCWVLLMEVFGRLNEVKHIIAKKNPWLEERVTNSESSCC